MADAVSPKVAIRRATVHDAADILDLVNGLATDQVMLPRSPASVTSQRTAMASPPCFSMSERSASRRSMLRAESATRAPSRTKAWAASAPRPGPAPAISATFPSSSPTCASSGS